MTYDSVTISLRAPHADIAGLVKFIDAGRFRNMSDAIRETSKVGARILNYQDAMADPARAEEMRKKMNEILRQDQIMGWAETLDDGQIEGFIQLLQLEKDRRYKLAPLI